MNEAYLLLWLEGPLQSWGYDSVFGRRDTLEFPTKSGVLGLLCCARGAGDEQVEWLSRWACRDMQVVSYVRRNSKGEPMPRLPLLRDFHMVGSGYDEKDPWESLLIPKTAEGTRAVGGGTKLTHRYYLQDTAFAVFMQGPEDELLELKHALINPVWDVYLGRKSCVPTEFIFQGIHATLGKVREHAAVLADEKMRVPSFQVLQGEYDGEIINLRDVPVQFGSRKLYRDRFVTIQRME